jgi:hypothetical protein
LHRSVNIDALKSYNSTVDENIPENIFHLFGNKS